MHRIVGAVMIIVAGSMLGFMKADSLKQRVQDINKIITGLNLLETEISYGKRDLKDALFSIGEHINVDFFKKVSNGIDDLGTRKALNVALLDENALLERDKAPILALGENLGMTDGESQVVAIKRAVSALCELKKGAETEYERLGRLYRSTGVLGGILVAIILM